MCDPDLDGRIQLEDLGLDLLGVAAAGLDLDEFHSSVMDEDETEFPLLGLVHDDMRNLVYLYRVFLVFSREDDSLLIVNDAILALPYGPVEEAHGHCICYLGCQRPPAFAVDGGKNKY